jgi:hypothetical protein
VTLLLELSQREWQRREARQLSLLQYVRPPVLQQDIRMLVSSTVASAVSNSMFVAIT